MKNYELTVVFHPDLEMNLDPALDKVKKIIKANGGEIIKEENEGKKRLSYDIDGQEFGIYDYFTISLPPESVSKIDSTLNITDEVIRHMVVKEDPRKLKAESLQKEETEGEGPTDDAAELNETEGE
ncbi:30S ribosomal protein S6 [Candidatus Saccharibacteria bacterium]|nr:30S ribosomal protein S6 [Candidatus Saccharibacteria bacterium]